MRVKCFLQQIRAYAKLRLSADLMTLCISASCFQKNTKPRHRNIVHQIKFFQSIVYFYKIKFFSFNKSSVLLKMHNKMQMCWIHTNMQLKAVC